MQIAQFKGFLFPHNPSAIRLTKPSRHGVFFCPGHGEVVQSLGGGAAEITCEGSFVCASADDAAALVADFEEKTSGGAGILILPGREPLFAVLTSHSFEQTGDGRAIPYTMRFLEADPAFYTGV